MSDADDGLPKIMGHGLRPFDVQWTRVETGATSGGVPDSEACFRGGGQCWVEAKATRTLRVTIRPEQVGWHLRRARLGGRSFFAVRRRSDAGPRRGVARDELWLVPGGDAEALLRDGLGGHLRVLYRGEGGPSSWDWERVAAILSGRATWG